jgi:signal transduction histidine kinase
MTREEADEVRAAFVAGEDPVQHVVAWRVQDGGERVVAWSSTATRGAAGDVRSVISVGRDLTGQRAAEARARRAHAALDLRSKELERSNADLAEFAALASDDLRAPIHAVSGFADLLEADAAPALAPRDRSHLTALREAAGHAGEMLDGLAAYGRLGHGEALARDVDCEGTLDAVLADLAGELEARDAVVTREPLPVVPGDPEELHALFVNLIANAVRHGAPEAPRVHVGAERRGLGWQLTFADDGAGVPDVERQRIFQLFRRLHPRDAQRGSGVGLALCRRIVERHGGAIWVDDAEDGGSVFCVSLPDREAR